MWETIWSWLGENWGWVLVILLLARLQPPSTKVEAAVMVIAARLDKICAVMDDLKLNICTNGGGIEPTIPMYLSECRDRLTSLHVDLMELLDVTERIAIEQGIDLLPPKKPG